MVLVMSVEYEEKDLNSTFCKFVSLFSPDPAGVVSLDPSSNSCVCFCCRFPMVSWTNCIVKMMVHVFVSAAGFHW